MYFGVVNLMRINNTYVLFKQKEASAKSKSATWTNNSCFVGTLSIICAPYKPLRFVFDSNRIFPLHKRNNKVICHVVANNFKVDFKGAFGVLRMYVV